MERIDFSLGGGYPAFVGAGALDYLSETVKAYGKKKAALIADSGVPAEHTAKCAAALDTAGLSASVYKTPCGEEHKRLSAVEGIYSFLYENRFTRADIVLGLGGGVLLDTAGFAAATYLRGLPFLSVPSTLIAQTDSAYGGKTGVDFLGGKNHIGVFSHPKAVFCDTVLLKTLPERERVCGMGEIIKYGAIADPDILEGVSRELPSDETIASCVRIKRGFVEADEFDTGVRRVLNFGHTYGHAFEAASGFTLPHGQAVAYGMLAAIRLGERMNVTERGVYDPVEAACVRAGLDTDWESRLEKAARFIERDKKSDGRRIDFVLLEKLGKPVRKSVGTDEVKEFLY